MFTLSPEQWTSLQALWDFEQDVIGVHDDICDEIAEFVGKPIPQFRS